MTTSTIMWQGNVHGCEATTRSAANLRTVMAHVPEHVPNGSGTPHMAAPNINNPNNKRQCTTTPAAIATSTCSDHNVMMQLRVFLHDHIIQVDSPRFLTIHTTLSAISTPQHLAPHRCHAYHTSRSTSCSHNQRRFSHAPAGRIQS